MLLLVRAGIERQRSSGRRVAVSSKTNALIDPSIDSPGVPADGSGAKLDRSGEAILLDHFVDGRTLEARPMDDLGQSKDAWGRSIRAGVSLVE